MKITFYYINEILAYTCCRKKCRLLSISKQGQFCVYYLNVSFSFISLWDNSYRLDLIMQILHFLNCIIFLIDFFGELFLKVTLDLTRICFTITLFIYL